MTFPYSDCLKSPRRMSAMDQAKLLKLWTVALLVGTDFPRLRTVRLRTGEHPTRQPVKFFDADNHDHRTIVFFNQNGFVTGEINEMAKGVFRLGCG
jgi:hypothetical protein